MRRVVPTGLRHRIRDLSDRFDIGPLPDHPYPQQFTPEMDLPERDRAERFVLIASTPRCGSHYLGHMLGSTGECGVPLEYFNETNRRHWARRFRLTDMEDLFPELVRHRTSPNGTFALKAHWHQLHPHIGALDRLTRGLGFGKNIWILRRDLLSQAISSVVASQTGAWISGAASGLTAEYDYDAIVRSAESVRRSNLCWRDHFAALPPNSKMTVIFEDLLSDETVCEGIGKFLGIGAKLTPSKRTKKQGNELNAAWKRRFADEVHADDRWILDPPDWIEGRGSQDPHS